MGKYESIQISPRDMCPVLNQMLCVSIYLRTCCHFADTGFKHKWHRSGKGLEIVEHTGFYQQAKGAQR
jgi:hypothetical protein